MQINPGKSSVSRSPVKSAIQLLGCVIAFSFSTYSLAAPVSGDLTVAANFLEILPTPDVNATGIDFGDAVVAADSILASDAYTGAAFSSILGTGDLSTFSFGPESLNARFYDFDLSGVVNSAGLLFTYADYIVEDLGTGISTIATSGGGSLTALDFNGSGILKSLSGSFDDTLITWKFGTTGINGGQMTIYATGLSAPNNPVPVPAAVWLFASGLIGMFSFRLLKR